MQTQPHDFATVARQVLTTHRRTVEPKDGPQDFDAAEHCDICDARGIRRYDYGVDPLGIQLCDPCAERGGHR